MIPPQDTCLACGAEHDPRQEYCLACGARLARRSGALHALGAAWQRHLPWYPGDWIWPSMLALLIAAAGAAAAILATGGSASAARTLVATTNPRPVPATTAAPPPPTTTAPPQPTIATTPKPKSRLVRWPGTNGYTVVLASETTRAAAREKALAALAQGLPKVGILVSARYSSLHPGYYVVFSGVYQTLADAQTAAGTASRRYPSAYARQITR